VFLEVFIIWAFINAYINVNVIFYCILDSFNCFWHFINVDSISSNQSPTELAFLNDEVNRTSLSRGNREIIYTIEVA